MDCAESLPNELHCKRAQCFVWNFFYFPMTDLLRAEWPTTDPVLEHVDEPVCVFFFIATGKFPIVRKCVS